MVATVISAAVVVIVAIAAGQLVAAFCGAERWFPASPAVGLALMVGVAPAALHLPGRMVAAAVILGALAVAGAALFVLRPAHRPPAGALLAGAATFALTLIPFVAQGYSGILGVSFNNDMAPHLLYAHAYRDAFAAHATPILTYYPFGPHAAAAALSKALHVDVVPAFVGLTVATPVLTALALHGLLWKLGGAARVGAAAAAALPYIAAGYLGQGAFKELMLTTLLVGVVAWLTWLRVEKPPAIGRLIPGGLLVVGILSVYSLPGLAWPGVLVLAVVAVGVLGSWQASSLRAALAQARPLVIPAVVAAGVAAVMLVPQVPRLSAFWDYMRSTGTGTGIPEDSLGNLVGPVDGLEAAGIWFNQDFRLPADGFTLGVLCALVVLAVALWGVVRLIREREVELPAALAVCLLLWVYADRTQSPYSTAKALVPLSTFIVAVAAVGIASPIVAPRALRTLRSLAALALLGLVVISSARVLRAMPVGPMVQYRAVAAFADRMRGDAVVYTANDEFANVRLAGAGVIQPEFASGSPWVVPGSVRPGKKLDPATVQGHDIDTFLPEILNTATWAVVPRSSADSAMPSAFRRVARSGLWELYRRVAPVGPRSVLSGEHGASGAVLRCTAPSGRRIAAQPGVAGIRPRSYTIPIPAIPAGATGTYEAKVPPGTYTVGLAYAWRQPVVVRAPGMKAKMPPTLDRVGPAFDVGTTTVTGDTTLITVTPTRRRVATTLAPLTGSLVLTPVGGERVVPLRRACGRYVDWYQPS